ncbi:MAG: MotA/TolQ/ExbB proton channel family protein [candidate division Zixibacteria bacterium]|nr:MotA/TolQ/ExbB proton channel family protein [candidate division Zixibacteria bacterium]
MKQSVFVTLVLVVSLAVGFLIWSQLPTYLREGGPLVGVLISLSVMLLAFILERLFTLRKARGKASVQSFFKNVIMMLDKEDFDSAVAACDKQRGTTANVLRAGIERYKQLKDAGISSEKRLSETQRAIEEANALEVPLLERNLIALSTIASIATMVGLLGTTIGMIRAFAATSQRVGGVVDAMMLARGIAEALVNTAGGLFNAIIGIVAYNFFVNKVDAFNYTMDEASYEVLQLLKNKEAEK